MSDEPRWTKLHTFSSSFEADMLVEILNEADIPTLVQGPEAGIYGFGFGGVTPRGATVLVPSDRVEEAKEIMKASPLFTEGDEG